MGRGLSSGQPEAFRADRRRFLGISVACLGLTALASRALADGIDDILQATASAAPGPAGSDGAILAAARAGLERAGSRIAHSDVVAVADFGQPSKELRLHLVDLAQGKVERLLVAHGRGSDPSHTGWLRSFSNAPGSAATSQGNYLTGEYYSGHHGRSMRLEGLDPTNSNAAERAIVVHAADYVSADTVRAHGVLGRSEGCFAVSQADLDKVLDRLGPGRLLVAAKLQV